MTQSSRPVAGMLWMGLAGLCFVAVTATVKYIGSDIPAAQAAFLRYVLGWVFLLPLIPRLQQERVSRPEMGLYALRGAFHAGAVALWFFAMTQISIAEVTAMNYLSPVYVTLGAALFLGERLATRRLLAVLAALVGALVILRPGFREVSAGHLAMILTALCFAGSYLIAKRMTDRSSPEMVFAMLSLTVTVGLFPLALPVWVTPSLGQLGWLFVIAAFAQAGHYTMTLAFRAAPVTVTQPVGYLQLVWATLLGWAVFNEGIDPYVILGGLIIVGSVTYITLREAQLRRNRARQTPDG